METLTQPKPFVKWAGGKQGIAKTLVGMFPRRFDRFLEPFLGGGSVLLTLSPRRATVGDLNEWLLDTYVAIRDFWEQVAAVLDTLPNTKEDYLRIRSTKPSSLDFPTRAAYFIFLNKTCFRGLFRVNRQGMFNVPYGAYQRAYYDPVNLAAVSRAIQTFDFRHVDFEQLLESATSEDFVYLDPPYHKLGGYSDFNRYTHCQFREADHVRLAACCREMNRRGIRWAVSNSDTPFVRSLFEGFRAISVENRREINLNSQSRSIQELLIVNFEPPKRPQKQLPFDD